MLTFNNRPIRGSLILLLLAGSFCQSVAQHVHPEAPAFGALGKVNFENSCRRSLKAQFNLAVALLHSFEFDEAAMAFRALKVRDPDCSIAAWGIALANLRQLGPNMSSDVLRDGWKELEPELSSRRGTAREQEYLSAVAALYRGYENAPGEIRWNRYLAAMSALRTHFPADAEASAFYAIALIDSAGPGLVGLARQKHALDILQPLFARNPRHPGLAHYIIHAADTPELAPMALAAAREYARIAPASPHALHMPSHIFSRLGLWDEMIRSNLESARVAHEWVAQGRDGAFDEEHARGYLEYAYLQTGQQSKALEQMKLNAKTGASGGWLEVDNRIVYDLETHDWEHARRIKPPASSTFAENFEAFWINCIADARLGDVPAAERDFELFQNSSFAFLKEKSIYEPTIHLEMLQARAWLYRARQEDVHAIAGFDEAVRFEQVNPVMYSDALIKPSHELLADLLLELHRPAGALTEYERALTVAPARFNSLYGAFRAARDQSDAKSTHKYASALLATCAQNSDRSEVREVRQWEKTHR